MSATVRLPVLRRALTPLRRIRPMAKPSHVPRSVHTQYQPAYDHSDTQSYTIDATLFEVRSHSYASSDRPNSRYTNAPTAVQNRIALSTLILANDLAKASKTLLELQALQAEIQPYALFSHAALENARQGNVELALIWLKLVPPRRSLNRDKMPKDIHSDIFALVESIRGQAKVEALWQSLLIIANLGYLNPGTNDASVDESLSRAFHWLMSRESCEEEWSIQFWKKFVGQVVWSRSDTQHKDLCSSRLADNTLFRHDLFDIPGSSRKSIEFILREIYNTCIKALALSGQYDIALRWLETDPVFQNKDDSVFFLPRLHVVRPGVWKAVLQGIFSESNNVPTATRNRALDLLENVKERANHTISEQGTDAPARGQRLKEVLDHLSTRSVRLARDGNAMTGGEDAVQNPISRAMLAKEARVRLQANQQRELSVVLRQALSEGLVVPDGSTLALIARSATHEDLKSYLAMLGKGDDNLRSERLRMKLSYLQSLGDYLPALQSYFLEVEDRQLIGLASLVLQAAEQEKVFARPPGPSVEGAQILIPRSHLSHSGLRCLIGHLSYDSDRLQTLYTAWLKTVARFRGTDAGADTDEGEAAKAEAGVTLAEARFRPTRAHFVAFLRYLPRSFTVRARSVSGKDMSDEMASDLRAQAKAFALKIAEDAAQFGLPRRMDMVNLMLDTFVRSLDVYADDHSEDLERVRSLLDSIGYGGHALAPDAARAGDAEGGPDKATVEVRASPLTYAYLIRAYLSVQRKQGGPMLNEAQEVYETFARDGYAQALLRSPPFRFERVMKEAEKALEDVRSDVDRRSGYHGQVSDPGANVAL